MLASRMDQPFDRALAAHRAGDFAAAEQGYRQVMHFKNALHNLGVLYLESGRPEAAEAPLRRVLEHFPNFAPSRHSLSMTLLALRRYDQAWPFYEARREVLPIADPPTQAPEWRGEPLAGKTLAVVREQGIGDQIMFGRYLAQLDAMGAEVVLACDPRTVARLFEAAGRRTRPYPREARGPLPPCDYWCFFGSLPLWLTPFPPPAVFLPQFGGGGGGVGVVATGSPSHAYDVHRSLPAEAAARLLSLGRDLLPKATGAFDLLDTAEIVAGLDLVIAVDTSIVHLAGAMGKPCWVLLPRIGLDFRWNDGVASDWYPQLRLFRQGEPGDWRTVLDEVSAALRAL